MLLQQIRSDNSRKRYFLLIAGLGLLFPVLVYPQSTVTFRLDLSDEISNHIFNPEGDRVELLGDRSPLSLTEGTPLHTGAAGEYMYMVTIEFPRSAVGKELLYQFALTMSGTYQQEDPDPPRRVVLTPGQKILQPAQLRIDFQLFDSRGPINSDNLLGIQLLYWKLLWKPRIDTNMLKKQYDY